jgi:hypothetical protein
VALTLSSPFYASLARFLVIEASGAWLLTRALPFLSLAATAAHTLAVQSPRVAALSARLSLFLSRVRVDANLPLFFPRSPALAELPVPAAAALVLATARALADALFAWALQAAAAAFAAAALVIAAAPALAAAATAVAAAAATAAVDSAPDGASGLNAAAVPGLVFSLCATTTVATLVTIAFPLHFRLIPAQAPRQPLKGTAPVRLAAVAARWHWLNAHAGPVCQLLLSLCICAATAATLASPGAAPAAAATASTATAADAALGLTAVTVRDVVTVGVTVALALGFYAAAPAADADTDASTDTGADTSADPGADTDSGAGAGAGAGCAGTDSAPTGSNGAAADAAGGHADAFAGAGREWRGDGVAGAY